MNSNIVNAVDESRVGRDYVQGESQTLLWCIRLIHFHAHTVYIQTLRNNQDNDWFQLPYNLYNRQMDDSIFSLYINWSVVLLLQLH